MTYNKKNLPQSNKILSLYPDRIPVIITKDRNSTIPDIDKNNFLVPKEFKLGELHHIIRKRIKLKPEIAIFLIVNRNKIISINQLIKNVYDEYKNEDGFLYITYTGEKTFG